MQKLTDVSLGVMLRWLGVFAGLLLGVSQVQAQSGQPIEILNSDLLTEIRSDTGNAVRRLLGNVRFKQDSTYMFCDSAYFYPVENQIEALSRVHIIIPDKKGGKTHIYADELQYDGKTRIAHFFYNVRLTDQKATLYTDDLVYYRNEGYARYEGGGRLVEEDNELRSKIGYYFNGPKKATFKTEVIGTSPGYVLTSDTLEYETQVKRMIFVDSTYIRSDNAQDLYTERGYYLTEVKEMLLYQHPWAQDSAYYLRADTLFYQDSLDWGTAHCNVLLRSLDTTTVILGERAYFRRSTFETWITDNAILVQQSDGDTMTLWGDTLYSINDTVRNIKRLRAYHHARFVSSDLQGSADSLDFGRLDSVLTMIGDPIMWAAESQLTGDTIQIWLKNKEPDSLRVYGNGFIVSSVREDYYNQIQGKQIFGKFRNRQLSWLFVQGNTEVVYYPTEEDSSITGLNRSFCGELTMWLVDNEPQKVLMNIDVEGKLYPLHLVTGEELFLERFEWLGDVRPRSYFIKSEPGVPAPLPEGEATEEEVPAGETGAPDTDG